ncbi:shikimate dehydrogenase [uncultured Desulfovibrio sp.]|uniref:shikimate dehydrogenase n=1 Tax=uncultured Desulfovibrio sp. TaxID=167968 RepID=UPI00263A2767|nr:shikimate dehydrogenase [uncultured Desulfovibrio sp.]
MQQAPFLPVELYGVIGWPLGQSLSPLIHNTAFEALGRDAVYLRWEIAPERLAAFVDSFRLLRMRGCSVTIPHKVAIMPYLDAVSASAQAVGAVNTLYWQDDALCGENTDVTGFMAPLLERALPKDTPVLLLGAGGAARAAAAGLRAHGFSDCTVCTPSDRTHVPLAEAFDMRAIAWKDRHDAPARLIINATPLGMYGKAEGETPYDFTQARAEGRTGLAYDIVYNPLRTRFLAEAETADWRTLGGLEMFHGQADAQFYLWTGRHLPAAARQALEAALHDGRERR